MSIATFLERQIARLWFWMENRERCRQAEWERRHRFMRIGPATPPKDDRSSIQRHWKSLS